MTEKIENKTLSAALVAIAREIKDPVKDARNPHFGNTYASLDSTIGEIRELAAKHGVAIMQSSEYIYVEGTTTYTETKWDKYEKREITTTTVYPNSYIRLVTELIHESGETKTIINSIPLTKPEPQSYGGSLTYDRRYADQAAFNVTGETDDDANNTQPVNRVQKRTEEHIPAPIMNDDAAILDGLAALINETATDIADYTNEPITAIIKQASAYINKKTGKEGYMTDPFGKFPNGSRFPKYWLESTLGKLEATLQELGGKMEVIE